MTTEQKKLKINYRLRVWINTNKNKLVRNQNCSKHLLIAGLICNKLFNSLDQQHF